MFPVQFGNDSAKQLDRTLSFVPVLLRFGDRFAGDRMKKKHEFLELEGLRVTVDRVVYREDAQTPVDRPHCFVYFISIHNNSDRTVTIKGRKWVVTNARGEVTAVEADGVVGEFPTIPVGEQFSYNSYHLLDFAPAVAEGSYLGVDETGRTVLTRIPRFEMELPSP